MSRRRSRGPTGPETRSWQRAVLARLGIVRLRQSDAQPASKSSIVVVRGGDMADKAHRTDHELLERPRRLRPSSGRRLARVAIVAMGVVVIALIGAFLGQRADRAVVPQPLDCTAAVKQQVWESAVRLCRIEVARTPEPAVILKLASAQTYSGDTVAGRLTASSLLDKPARSDALYLLGAIAVGEEKADEAIAFLEAAREAHRAEHRAIKIALDDGMLATLRMERSMFAESLRLIDECIRYATVAGDVEGQHYCHLIAARILIRVGYSPAADRELEQAALLSVDDMERSEDEYQRGNNFQEIGQHARAIERFKTAQRLRGTPAAIEKAHRLGGGSAELTWAAITELNLAYSCAELLRPHEAQRHLQIATMLDFEGKLIPDRAWTAAQIAYREGDLVRAAALTERYYKLRSTDDASSEDDPNYRDNRIDVAILRTRIELERNDLAAAERWAREGVAQAERVRGAQSALELRPWVLSKRRISYELLFTVLARTDRVEAAIMVFDAWQGRTVQDALATPRPSAALDRVAVANHLTRLGNWLSVASPAAFARPADQASVLGTMREIDLLALIVADDVVWRLTANHGTPRLVRVTELSKINDRLDAFHTEPTDLELAAELGALLVPDEVFRAQDEVLHVLVDGKLWGLPVGALRHGSAPLITVRPIVYGLRLPEQRCVRPAVPGHATVLGFADHRILYAIAEANQVAELLHTTSTNGLAATRKTLFDASHDAVLHVASHAVIGDDGAALVLADGEVSALEIAARHAAPALAVLSACDTATSDDRELGGAMVSGFLAAGSQHVIATLRPIADRGARDLMTMFYRADGITDPVRALAAAQAELAKTQNGDWPYYAVFGPSVCPDGATPLH